MRIENIEEANELVKERDKLLGILDLQDSTPVVVLSFNKQKPLDVHSQVTVTNRDSIKLLVVEQLIEVENKLRKLGVEFVEDKKSTEE